MEGHVYHILSEYVTVSNMENVDLVIENQHIYPQMNFMLHLNETP